MYFTLMYFTLCTMHLIRCTSLDVLQSIVLHSDVLHSVYYTLRFRRGLKSWTPPKANFCHVGMVRPEEGHATQEGALHNCANTLPAWLRKPFNL